MRRQGASREWGRAEQQPANSRRVNGEWADRTGREGGGQGKTAPLRRSPCPPYLCLLVGALDRPGGSSESA